MAVICNEISLENQPLRKYMSSHRNWYYLGSSVYSPTQRQSIEFDKDVRSWSYPHLEIGNASLQIVWIEAGDGITKRLIEETPAPFFVFHICCSMFVIFTHISWKRGTKIVLSPCLSTTAADEKGAPRSNEVSIFCNICLGSCAIDVKNGRQ